MTSLRQLVADTPEVVAALRSATVFDRSAPTDDGPDESRQVFSFGPKPPCDVDLLDWSDREAATLVGLVEVYGEVRVAGMWRYRIGPQAGHARGLLYDNLRPVVIASEVVLSWFDQGWTDEAFERRIRATRKRTMKRFGWLEAAFSADEDEAEDEPEEQLALHIL
ncbi:hypothetical protein SEA_TINALIN_59 [Gordonia phage TinaLin]|uniref:Uncharacterized protein n=1 Tax=Gordonia phage TinaLin TaxID=2797324 RepID=A0A7T7GTG9_9CAUD|nr:hypothetical protein KDJ60_gp47 [Gordonia phage TinaLin]QQM15147.1 hypothetical protein SEA_TINALIN_59 [Gordonia phage TinaLin]